MTMHPNPAERLFAMLDTDDAVEAMPKRQVRRDLEALGIDPSPSVAFAKALAGGAGAPAERLMGKIMAAEDADAEIARIEAADIDEVRGRVGRGTAAAIAAAARRQAGVDDKVVGLKRKRGGRRLIRWGAPLAGVAASLLVAVFFLGNTYLWNSRQAIKQQIAPEQPAVPAQAMPDASTEGYTKPDLDKSLTDNLKEMNPPRKPNPARQAKQKDAVPGADASADTLATNQLQQLAPEKKAPAPAPEAAGRLKTQEQLAPASPPAPSEGLATQPNADVAAKNESAAPPQAAANVQAAPVAEPPRVIEQAEEKPQEAAGAVSKRAAVPPAPATGVLRNVEVSEIAAALAVDPSLAPLQIQSPEFPKDGLEGRLAEAQRIAGDRPVIALYRVATGDMRRDYAQVPLDGGTQEFAAPPPLVGLLGVEAGAYDFIPLPPE